MHRGNDFVNPKTIWDNCEYGCYDDDFKFPYRCYNPNRDDHPARCNCFLLCGECGLIKETYPII